MISKRNILRFLLAISIKGLIVFVFISAYFFIQRNKTIVLPKPTGSYDVGRMGYDWIDSSRHEAFSNLKDMNRKLAVWIWYPTDVKQNAKKAEYFPAKWKKEQVKDNGVSYYLEQNFNTIQTNSFKGAPLSSRQHTYPVIIFEPGMGNIIFNYQVLAENLASHGYIVLGINPTYSSRFVVFSDGKVAYRIPKGNMPEDHPTDAQLNKKGSTLINTWTGDMMFAINQLGKMNTEQNNFWTGHIDMVHIGAFGHSFGGAASAKACLLDNQIMAGVDIDGFLYGVKGNLNKPFMFIMSQKQQNAIDVKELNKIKEAYDGLPKDGLLVKIPKASHFSFQDNALFFNPILKTMGVYGTINGKRGLQITNSYLTAFFDKYLKNQNRNLLVQKPSKYSEVEIEVK